MPWPVYPPLLSPRPTLTHVQDAERRRVFYGRFDIQYPDPAVKVDQHPDILCQFEDVHLEPINQ